MTLPFSDEYRDGEMVQCQRCAKNVRVKYYDKDAVVVVSSQEQQTLALRCQYCGYVLCDSCAHPADSLFPICPSCQREWGPYYFTHEAISPSSSKAAITPNVPPVTPQPQFTIQPTNPPPVQSAGNTIAPSDIGASTATVDTLGAGETDLYGEYRNWERKAVIKKILTFVLVFIFLGFLVFLAIGPGKPYVKKGLSLLSTRSTRSPTNVALIYTATLPAKTPEKNTPLVVNVSSTHTKPSVTLPAATDIKPTATTKTAPTATPTIIVTASPAPSNTIGPSATTQSNAPSDCVPALSVTLADVGKKLCVTGTVVYTTQRGTGFMIYFAKEDGYLRIVIYDRVPKDIKPGVCIWVTGVIKTLTELPVMALNYNDVVDICTP